jgi:hypothetical protein
MQRVVWALTALIVIPIATMRVALAQTPATNAAEPSAESAAMEAQSQSTRQVIGRDITSPAAGAVSGVQINASTTSNQAAINFGAPLSNGVTWSALLSSPITTGSTSSGGSSATNTNIATLDGLANGAAATFKWSTFQFLSKPAIGNDDTRAIEAKAMALCLKKSTKDACDKMDNAPGVLISTYDPDEKAAYLMEHFPALFGIVAYSAGLQASVGYNSFTYYNATSFAKASQNDAPRSFGAHAGIVPAWYSVPTFIDFSIRYQQAYMAQPSATKCKSVTSGISCQTGSFGIPADTDKLLLALSGNSEFKVFGKYIGISPQLIYDARNKQEGITFPLYFIHSMNSLIGGITAGWTNTAHFTVGVMVGAPFSYFGQ